MADRPETDETASADVLAAVLNTGDQIRHELVDGPFVDDRPRHTLCNLQLVQFTAHTNAANVPQEAGATIRFSCSLHTENWQF